MARKKAVTERRPSTATRVRRTVDERRTQLLELGLRAFTERKYDEVSIDAIAQEAGISRGLLFHYFATKHVYYVAVLEVAARELLTDIAAQAEGTELERLVAGLNAYFGFVERRAATYATLLRAGVGSDPVVAELVESTRARIVKQIRSVMPPVVRDGAEPRMLRATLRAWIGMVEALALDWVDHRDLSRAELVELGVRGMMLAVPQASTALSRVGGS